MADIADITDAIYAIVSAAACPSGVSNPGVTGKALAIGEGWPLAEDVDAAMAAGTSIVSIYVDPGYSDPGQLLDRWNTLIAPVHGMTATVNTSQSTITVSGTPGAGEYVTAVLQNWKGYSFGNPGSGTAASMAAGLAALIAVDHPGTVANGAVISVSGSLVRTARIGAPATLVRTLHRQKAIIRISAWSPTPADRSTIAQAIDIAMKQNLRVAMLDGTQALVRYDGTIILDRQQKLGEWRRDLLYSVQYDSTVQYPAYEITSAGPQTTISNQ